MRPEDLLAHFSEQQTAGFILVLARVSPLFVLAPLFSSKMLPARARGIVAVGLTVGIYRRSQAGAGQHIPLDVLRRSRASCSRSCSSALAFAFSLACLFAAHPGGRQLLDTLIGFSFGALVDPITGTNGAS